MHPDDDGAPGSPDGMGPWAGLAALFILAPGLAVAVSLMAGPALPPPVRVARVGAAESHDPGGSAAQHKPNAAGRSFRVGGLNYTIHDVERSQAVGSAYLKERAGPGVWFVVLTYTVRNRGDHPLLHEVARSVRLTAGEHTYSTSARANYALSTALGRDYMVTDLQPDVARTMVVAFEVPERVLGGFEIVLDDPSRLTAIAERAPHRF
jgi:hypothetical protein